MRFLDYFSGSGDSEGLFLVADILYMWHNPLGERRMLVSMSHTLGERHTCGNGEGLLSSYPVISTGPWNGNTNSLWNTEKKNFCLYSIPHLLILVTGKVVSLSDCSTQWRHSTSIVHKPLRYKVHGWSSTAHMWPGFWASWSLVRVRTPLSLTFSGDTSPAQVPESKPREGTDRSILQDKSYSHWWESLCSYSFCGSVNSEDERIH